MKYSNIIFRIDNNWFNYCPYNNRTGGCRDIVNRYFANLAEKTSPKCCQTKISLFIFI